MFIRLAPIKRKKVLIKFQMFNTNMKLSMQDFNEILQFLINNVPRTQNPTLHGLVLDLQKKRFVIITNGIDLVLSTLGKPR